MKEREEVNTFMSLTIVGFADNINFINCFRILQGKNFIKLLYILDACDT